MSTRDRLLILLADGRFRSGAEIAKQFGVSRAAIWKAARALSRFDLKVEAVRGRGYRLDAPLELLAPERIQPHLGDEARMLLSGMELHMELDSTNAHLNRLGAAGAQAGYVCLAERQIAGRGRRGRAWISPFARNIYLSLLWRVDSAEVPLGGLSLAAALAVVRALARSGIDGIGLKWPNDIWLQGRKLGGILVEISGESSGPCRVVTGVGLNVSMPPALGSAIDQPWTDLQQNDAPTVSRNRLAGLLIDELLVGLQRYTQDGLPPLQKQWPRWDVLAGRRVRVEQHGGVREGVARGIDQDGALLLEEAGGVGRCYYGEVSVRVA